MAIVVNFFCSAVVYGDAKVYKNSYRMFASREWNNRTIEELDNIFLTSDTKDNVGMRSAARLQVLSEAYFERYREHNGSEGVGRGQELQERAYDLLHQALGPWHTHTINSLQKLCCWNISAARRRSLLKEAISQSKSHIPRKLTQGDWAKLEALSSLIICCLRNEDYGDDVKELQMLLVERHSVVALDEKRVVNVYIGQRNWVAAVEVASRLINDCNRLGGDPILAVKCRAMLGEAHIMLGRLYLGEVTLLAGTHLEQERWTEIRISPCCERLIELYIEQEKWKQAEELLLQLIDAKTSKIGKRTWALGEKMTELSWLKIDGIVRRIVEMDQWRAEESGQNMAVYYLLELYNNKLQLGLVYKQQRRFLEAQQQLEALVELGLHKRNRILEESKELLISVHLELGNLDEAESLQETIVKDIDEVSGPHFEDKVVPALRHLSDICRRNNHWARSHDVQIRLLKYR